MITSAVLFIWDGNKLFACFAISDMASNKKKEPVMGSKTNPNLY